MGFEPWNSHLGWRGLFPADGVLSDLGLDLLQLLLECCPERLGVQWLDGSVEASKGHAQGLVFWGQPGRWPKNGEPILAEANGNQAALIMFRRPLRATHE